MACQQQQRAFTPDCHRLMVPKAAGRISRRDLATLLGVHQDTLSRVLRDGLGIAVVEWGGRGKEMSFDLPLALRYWNANSCRRWDGRRCLTCESALEDCRNTAEHLIAERHAYSGCAECRTTWEVGIPCRGVEVPYS
jgi:hypothetical protein